MVAPWARVYRRDRNTGIVIAMVEIKTPSELTAMREAGRVVARALAAVRARAAVGVRLAELDEVAASVIADAGAKPAFLHYQPGFAPSPFPAVICASVNEVIVHGIPDASRLRDGDLVSIDCGAYLDGWAGDSAISFTVGRAEVADAALVSACERALAAGIAAAVPGNRMGDIGAAIARGAAEGGYGIMEDFGGHGIGRKMHEDPGCPTGAVRGAGWCCVRGWRWRSSRCSRRGLGAMEFWPTGGGCTRSTGRVRRTRSTASRSRPRRWC